MKTLISKTGRIYGRGSDPWKHVMGLTREERQAVRLGDLVLLPDDNTHPQCSLFKRVHWKRRMGYYHRNATEAECKAGFRAERRGA